MIPPPFIVSFRGAAPDAIAAAAIACGWLPDGTPEIVELDAGTGTWLERFAATPLEAIAVWGSRDEPRASVAHSQGATVLLTAERPTRAAFLDRLAAVPFEVAVVSRLHAWNEPPVRYRAPGFGQMLPALGWACAFRGRGHDRLVSRRWLRFGPWRLDERPGDLSFVEFHDLDADAETALTQARPGHRRLGIGDEGGYLQQPYVYAALPRGFRDPTTNVLKVVVAGRPLSPVEMTDACALRIETRALDPGPVTNVAYVFVDEPEAEPYLHELWLRALECRVIRLGREVRLDETYAPTPSPPSWA